MNLTDFTNPTAAFEPIVQRHHDREALSCGERSVTFGDLATRAGAYAGIMATAGLGVGDRVALLGKNSIDYVAALLGAFRIGAVAVPLNWRLTAAELGAVIGDAAPALCFHSGGYADRVAALDLHGATPVLLDEEAVCVGRDAPTAATVGLADAALQIYTSGTTGRPKGAVHTNRGLSRFFDLEQPYYPEWFRCSPALRYLVTVPLFHVGGLEMVFRTIFSGGCAILLEEFDITQLLASIARDRVNCTALVPTALQMVLADPRATEVDFSGLGTLFYGGAPMMPSLLDRAIGMLPNCRFVQTFGMTEAGGSILALPPEDHVLPPIDRTRSVGRPLPHTEARVADQTGASLPPETIGEILVRSPFLMRGYHHREELDVKTIDADGWLHTGDAGRMDQDGYFYLHDRLCDMIISGGENVYPSEVEAVIAAHPDVEEVAVIGLPDDVWGERVHGVIVMRRDVELTEHELTAWARKRLAGYKTPKGFTRTEELAKNAIGKVSRKAVREAVMAGRVDAP